MEAGVQEQEHLVPAKPFQLWVLLYLYENANSADVFPNYMEGMELLAAWLGPLEIPSHPIQYIPKLHRNYELNRIAEAINVHPSIVYKEYDEVITHYEFNY